jgi:hypothetical protein
MDTDDVLMMGIKVIYDRTTIPCKLTGGKRGAFRATLKDSDGAVLGVGVHHRSSERALDFALDEMTTAQDTRADMVAEVRDARKDSGV